MLSIVAHQWQWIAYRVCTMTNDRTEEFEKWKKEFISSNNLDKNWVKHRIKKEYPTRIRRPKYQTKIATKVRADLCHAIRGNFRKGVALSSLGCTILEVKRYLKKQFKNGMTWENWSRTGWHIDHIIPLSAFDLTDKKQLHKALHYTNLQPLWAKDNWKKGFKVIHS